MLAEFFQGVAVTAGDGLQRCAEQFGDLAKAEVLPHVQMDDAALLLGQRSESVSELLARFGVRRLKPARCLLLESIERFLLATATAQDIEREVPRQREEQSTLGLRLGERRLAAGELQEELLHDVLREQLIARDAPGETIHAEGMFSVESCEGVFSGRHARGQFRRRRVRAVVLFAVTKKKQPVWLLRSSRASLIVKLGDPYENRTRVASVKGMCPNR